MINSGKRFEQNFKKSLGMDVFVYRLKDSASSYYGGNQNLRFSAHNMCDYIVFTQNKLWLMELKSHKGKSLPLNCIREKQLEELRETQSYKNVKQGILVEFSDLKRYFWIPIDILDRYFEENETKKSIPLAYIEEHCIEIASEQKKVNYLLEIDDLFKEG